MKKLFITLFTLLSTLSFAQSRECVKIKSSKNSEGQSINLVFVGSAFGSQLNQFEATVRRHWRAIERFTPFSPQINTMNVWIVKASSPTDGFCASSSPIERLITCDITKAKALADRCTSQTNREIIVIHNSDQHGGSGGEISVSTNSPYAPATIVHEIGHTLFKLADEYTRSDAGGRGPNCGGQFRQCSGWQDLIDAGLATCESGCRNNSKFTSSPSIMRDLNETSFGHMNQRNICCIFKQKTGEYPRFCQTYQNIGAGLDSYCGAGGSIPSNPSNPSDPNESVRRFFSRLRNVGQNLNERLNESLNNNQTSGGN